MYFDQKLRGLMQLFKLSNSKLARGINVDASLISRWKSGERAMSANSPHVPAIASFFLRLNAYHYQKEYLDFILKNRLPPDRQQDEGRRIHALSDWLISDEPAELSAAMEKPQSPVITKNIIANIAGLMSSPAMTKAPVVPTAAEQAVQINQLPVITPGEAHKYERYEGIKGRRQAVLNFLLEIIHSDRRQELLLTSEDDMGWLTGDRQFTMIWASLLKQVIESGHRISIIHVVNRQRNEIIEALTYWMPLHLSGRMKSYYLPKYVDQPVRQTLFIARGRCAVVAWTTETTTDSQTFIYKEKATVALYESIFESHLTHCKPLFSVFSRKNTRELLETGLVLRKREGSIYHIRNQLNSLLLDPAAIKSFLTADPTDIRATEILEGLLQHRQTFFERLAFEDYFDILPLDLLEQIQTGGQAQIDSCLLCLEQPWTVDARGTIRWLENMVAALKQYPHYQVYFSSQLPGLEDVRVNILYKESCGALFSPGCTLRRQGISILLNEANILRSLSYYFDDFISQIPTVQRQKEEVIIQIEKVIQSLKSQQRKAASTATAPERADTSA